MAYFFPILAIVTFCLWFLLERGSWLSYLLISVILFGLTTYAAAQRSRFFAITERYAGYTAVTPASHLPLLGADYWKFIQKGVSGLRTN